MANETNISWTDSTWNIARGCTKVSAGCKNCYMYRDGKRFNFASDKVIRTKSVFNLPLKIKKPSKIFTCSLTDFFHPDIDAYRNEAWEIIRKCPQHTFQILTKRPERFKECLPEDWGEGYPNVWLGTTIESFEYSKRIYILLHTKAAKRFISCEPLIMPVNLKNLVSETINNIDATTGINLVELPEGVGGAEFLPALDWVIVGCESGTNRRDTKIEWVRNIVVQCQKAKKPIPVFVKQLEINGKVETDITKFPEDLQIRQFPI